MYVMVFRIMVPCSDVELKQLTLWEMFDIMVPRSAALVYE